MNDAERNLMSLITIYSGKKPLNKTTRIYYDLWISGDDASQLLDGLAKDFDIDMGGFEFARFFPDESESLLEYWGSRLGFARKREPLTVADLLRSIESGRWVDPGSLAG